MCARLCESDESDLLVATGRCHLGCVKRPNGGELEHGMPCEAFDRGVKPTAGVLAQDPQVRDIAEGNASALLRSASPTDRPKRWQSLAAGERLACCG